MREPLLHSFEAITHSAISVVNAIPAGKGVTIAIDIPCRVQAVISKRESRDKNITVSSKVDDPHELVTITVKYALQYLKAEIPKPLQLELKIESKIPAAVGLKSSSAVSVAAAKAVFGLFSRDRESSSILKVSCTASKDSGASLTGAYDDAAASLLGGLAYTNNTKFQLLKHSSVPRNIGRYVAILVPNDQKKLTSSIEASTYARYREESLNAFDYSMNGDFASAMMLNSIIQCAALKYSVRPVSAALTEGAGAAGITGKGPAVAALCRELEILRRVRSRWKKENENCRVLTTNIVQPWDA